MFFERGRENAPLGNLEFLIGFVRDKKREILGKEMREVGVMKLGEIIEINTVKFPYLWSRKFGYFWKMFKKGEWLTFVCTEIRMNRKLLKRGI